MKIVRCAFVSILVVGLSLPMFSCSAARYGTGLEEYKDPVDGTLKVRVKPGAAPVDTAANLISILGPWGIAAAAGLRLGSKFFRHKEILAHGQKDDDFDGVPDDQQKPPTVPPAAAA